MGCGGGGQRMGTLLRLCSNHMQYTEILCKLNYCSSIGSELESESAIESKSQESEEETESDLA